MDKNGVYEFLNLRDIRYEVTEHKTVFNMAERRPDPERRS